MGVIKNRKADCHPAEKHFAFGMCYKCYKHEYHKKNAKVHIERASRHYQNNKGQRLRAIRNAFLKKEYGLTIEDYERMVMEQNNSCALCGKHQTVSKVRRKAAVRKQRELVVDHNHTTNKVRALLCNRCNTGLWAIENIDWRNKAEEYLRIYDKRS